MPHVTYSTDIDAPPSVVFRLLTDTNGYDAWNPLFRILRGRLAVGSLIVAKIDANGIPFVFDARISRLEPDRCLAWRGPSMKWFAPIASGEHTFELIDLGNGRTRLVHSERFEGALMNVRKLWKPLEKQLGVLYPRFNEAIKKRAESRP